MNENDPEVDIDLETVDAERKAMYDAVFEENHRMQALAREQATHAISRAQRYEAMGFHERQVAAYHLLQVNALSAQLADQLSSEFNLKVIQAAQGEVPDDGTQEAP